MNLLQNLKIHYKLSQFLFCFVIFFFFFLNTSNLIAQEKVFKVVLDAGHGGKDPGKVGYKKYKEKDIALAIVLQVGKLLKNKKNIKVIYTRKTDVFVNLWERGDIANRADADLFVSVHCNAHHTQASGSETWVLGISGNKRNIEVAKAENEVVFLEENYEEKYKGFDPNSPESLISLTLEQEESMDKSVSLATLVQENFKRSLRRIDRGVKQERFVVLYQSYMPSILIETGFLTNKKEGAYLNSKKGKTEMASAISKAILKYIEDIRLNTIAIPTVVATTTSQEVNTKKTPTSEEVYFKVQVASGRSKIKTTSYNFKGLKKIQRVPVGKFYKYYYGKTTSYRQAKKNLKIAKKKGYTSAFIAAFRGDKKVSLSEVIK